MELRLDGLVLATFLVNIELTAAHPLVFKFEQADMNRIAEALLRQNTPTKREEYLLMVSKVTRVFVSMVTRDFRK